MKNQIDKYLEHLKAAGRSGHTLRAYAHDLGKLSAFTDAQLEQITPPDVDRFLCDLRERGLSTQSINRTTTAMKGFFAWLVETDQLGQNPARLVKLKGGKNKPPVFLSPEQKAGLFKAIQDSRDNKASRDLAMFAFMGCVGLRVSEVASLNLEDLIEEKYIRVRTKGGKVEQKFLGKQMRKILSAWLKERKRMETSSPALFPGQNEEHKRLSAEWIRIRLRHWCKKAGIPEISPHKLRHTFATELLGKSGNLGLVKRALGHVRIETTLVYAHVTDQQLRQAMEGM